MGILWSHRSDFLLRMSVKSSGYIIYHSIGNFPAGYATYTTRLIPFITKDQSKKIGNYAYPDLRR
jgi:hypothetical protein